MKWYKDKEILDYKVQCQGAYIYFITNVKRNVNYCKSKINWPSIKSYHHFEVNIIFDFKKLYDKY